MFASKTLVEHLARGFVGLGALWLAWRLTDESLLFAVVLLPVALFALRGCPMCWLMGLGETLLAKLSGRSARATCIDGSCRRREPPSVDRMFRDLFGG
jgi:hypothetical protein